MCEVADTASHNMRLMRYDSVLGVRDIAEDLDAKLQYEEHKTLDAKPIVACGSESIGSSFNNQIELKTLKRGLAEANLSYAETPNKSARKSRQCSSDSISVEKMRVGCPFYKKNPKEHQKGSCRGIGFAEMGKLKDHLKCVHQLPESIYKNKLNFKERRFTSLKGIERKWKLVFQILFPEVPKDEIPSPCSNEDNVKLAPSSNDLATLRDNLRTILLDRYRIEILCEIPSLEIEFDILFSQAVEIWKTGTAIETTMRCEYSTADNTTSTGRESIIAEKHHDITAPPAYKQSPHQLDTASAQDLSGLQMVPNVKTEDPYEPFSSLAHQMDSQSPDDFDVKPAAQASLPDWNKPSWAAQCSATVSTLECEQHVSKVPKVDMTNLSTPVFDHDYPTMYDFDFSMPLGCGSPYMFDANLPSTLDFNLDFEYNPEVPMPAVDVSPAPSLMDVDTPFMGSDTPIDQNLVWFPELNKPEVAPPPSNGMQVSKKGFNTDEWLNSDTCTPCSEWSGEKMQAMHEELDRMFALM